VVVCKVELPLGLLAATRPPSPPPRLQDLLAWRRVASHLIRSRTVGGCSESRARLPHTLRSSLLKPYGARSQWKTEAILGGSETLIGVCIDRREGRHKRSRLPSIGRKEEHRE
jgi:hypothetical protein